MASEDLAGALAAVLGGQGLRVQNCDSGPAGEPPAPVRLRKNVCYVVLAVFLNEQVSVRPPALLWASGARSQPRWGPRANGRSHHCTVRGASQFYKALSHLHLSPAIVPIDRGGN